MQNANANATAILLNHVEGRCMWIAAEKQNKNTKKKTTKKWKTKKKEICFWTGHKCGVQARRHEAVKKMFPVTRQEKIEGEAAWKKCMANGSGKMKKKVLQRGASRNRSGERSEPKLRQGCSVAAMKKNSLGIAATATATATATTTTMARRGR